MGADIFIIPSKIVKAAKIAIKKGEPIIIKKKPVKSLEELIGDDELEEFLVGSIDPKVKFFLIDVKD